MVNISKTKRNFIWWHTLFAVISGALGAVILHFALPGHYFGGYPFIPIYFYFFGLFSIYAFDACRRHAPQRMLLLYLKKITDGTDEFDVFDESSNLFSLKNWTSKAVPLSQAYGRFCVCFSLY